MKDLIKFVELSVGNIYKIETLITNQNGQIFISGFAKSKFFPFRE